LTDPFAAVDLLFPLSPKPCLVAISSRHVNSSKSVAAFASGFSSNAYYRTSMPRNPPEITIRRVARVEIPFPDLGGSSQKQKDNEPSHSRKKMYF